MLQSTLFKWTRPWKRWNFLCEQQEPYLYKECWVHLSKPKILCHLLNRSLTMQDTYCTQQALFLMLKPYQLMFLKESKLHKPQSCDGGKGQHRFPETTHSKRSQWCRQGLGVTKKLHVNRNILPRILRLHLWSNSFQVSVVLAGIIQREPNRLQSHQKWL